MAKIKESSIFIKLSKIVKDIDVDFAEVVDDATHDTLKSSVVELIESIINDPAVVVEVININDEQD